MEAGRGRDRNTGPDWGRDAQNRPWDSSNSSQWGSQPPSDRYRETYRRRSRSPSGRW